MSNRLARTLCLTASLLLIGSISVGCAHLAKKNLHSANTHARQPLTGEEAQSRSRQVSRVRYALWFAVNGSYPDFEGRTVVQFNWRPDKNSGAVPLFLDFTGGKISSLKINDQLIPEETFSSLYNGSRLRLPQEHLLPGLNRVQIAYSQNYSRNGTGLHRFEDPVDKRIYLYSHSEPYDANRIFPCFDQPDLKAVYELTVEAPADWAVISNTADREVVTFDGRASWSFPVSPPFSTYLFALHAGPYEVWKSESNGIPLRLFARDSLKSYVQPKEWFEITKAGLEFYSSHFGYQYPFIKYDQILVPEFNAGAMENVAAVTFADRLAFRSKPTLAQLRSRAETILHELAHMWFGNLVTMRWWNGLWLNESFATYASNWALESLSQDHAYLKQTDWAREYRENPGRDLFQEKKWAYTSDQSITTHAIDVPVRDTDEAESNFDGITYSKGASVLKQLAYFLGEEDFQEGLQRYFQKYAFRNTTLFHFIGSLQEASEKSLESWLQEWIEAPGANTVEAQFSCGEDKKIVQFDLVQGNASGSSRLRTHRTQVALYDRGSRSQVLAVTYSGERTPVKEAIGKPCPAWVNPNHGDFDYALTRIDNSTRDFLLSTEPSLSPLSGKVSLLSRDQLWHALWQATLKGDLSASQYSEIFFRSGVKEKDPTLLGSLIRRMYSNSILAPSVSLWMDSKDRRILEEKLHTLARHQLLRTPADNDLRRRWWALALMTSTQPSEATWISELLEQKKTIPGLPLDQDRRWEALEAWARIPARNVEKFSQALIREEKHDQTDSGKKWALSIRAATASPEAKLAAFDLAISEKTSYSELREISDSFGWLGHEYMYPWLAERYFKVLPEILARKTNQEAADFVSGFFPLSCDGQTSVQLKTLLERENTLPASVLKSLRSIQEEQDRCVRLRMVNANQARPGNDLNPSPRVDAEQKASDQKTPD